MDNNAASQDTHKASQVASELFDALCSEEFQTLIQVDALNGIRKFHPIYVLGYDADTLKRMRNSYVADKQIDKSSDIYRVGMYSVPNIDNVLKRVGIPPSIMVLAPDVELAGAVHAFVKQNHVPVLRILRNRVALVQLPNADYYGGVYDILEEEDISNSTIWSRTINIGLVVWLRTRGFRDNTATPVSLRETKAIRRSQLPKPEPSFSQFVRKQLERLGFAADTDSAALSSMSPASSFDFGNARNAKNTAQALEEVRQKLRSALSYPDNNTAQPNY